MSETFTDDHPQETHLLSDRYKSAVKHDAFVLHLLKLTVKGQLNFTNVTPDNIP